MLNYIRAELYRIYHKKSFYIYYLAIMILTTNLIVFSGTSMETHAQVQNLFMNAFLPMTLFFVGTQVFLMVYGDDFGSNTLSLVLSSGLTRFQMVFSKLIVFLIVAASVFVSLGIFGLGIWYYLMGSLPAINSSIVSQLMLTVLVYYLMITAMSVISATFMYLFQKSIFATVVYILGTAGLVSQLIGLLSGPFKFLKPLADNLLTMMLKSTAYLIIEQGIIQSKYFIVVLVYVLIGVIFQVFILEKKEIKLG